MIDVHAPHESVHTWTDFFIHIATIVVGLVIAIGLEQTVEFVHHRRERHHLQQQLTSDGHVAVADTQRIELSTTYELRWVTDRANQVFAALHGQKLPDPAPLRPLDYDVPDDAAWQAAKADGGLSVLSGEDVKAFAEVDSVAAIMLDAYNKQHDDRRRLFEFNWSIVGPASNHSDATFSLDSLTPGQKKKYLQILLSNIASLRTLRYWERQLRGAELCILSGERDLPQISKAERQFDNVP